MSGFVKIYGSHLLKSTLWEEAPEARLMFLSMLALADKDGFINVPLVRTLARLLNLPVEYVEKGLAVLEAPDPNSRSPEYEGRRVLRTSDGWQMVNHAKYRELRTEKQVQDAERQNRARHMPKQRDMSQGERDKRDMSQESRDKSPEGEAEANAEAKGEGEAESLTPSSEFPLDRCIREVNEARKELNLSPISHMQGDRTERLLFAALQICSDVRAAYAAYLANGDDWDASRDWPIARWAKNPMQWLSARPPKDKPKSAYRDLLLCE